jgi:hypothetical protein
VFHLLNKDGPEGSLPGLWNNRTVFHYPVFFTPQKYPSLLLSLGTVIPALVARITPVGPDLNLCRMTLVTYRAIVFHVEGLWFLIHGD